MHSPTPGKRCESLTITSFGLWYSMQNLNEQFFLGAMTMTLVHSALGDSITIFRAYSVCPLQRTALLSSLQSAVRYKMDTCLKASVRFSAWLFWYNPHVRSTCPHTRTVFQESYPCSPYTSWGAWFLFTNIWYAFFRLLVFFRGLLSVEACRCAADGDQDWHALIRTGLSCTQKAHHIYCVL